MDGDFPEGVVGYTFWGEPIYRVGRGRGRPPFEWTQENSWKVSMMLAMGWGNERIAKAVINPQTGKSISTATLKRYFRAELAPRDSARDQLFVKQMMSLAEQAFGGNTGAHRLLQQMIEKNDMALLDARHRKSKPEVQDADDLAPAKLGKKEQRVLAAQAVPDDYGDIFDRRRRRMI